MTTHPRISFRHDGIEAPARAFADALRRGRLHHAWLLTGPEGVGKAGFAYRVARRLLGAVDAPDYGPLGADPEDKVSRLVAARAHPDLLVLERAEDDGKLKRVISVDQARGLPGFFAKAPAIAPYRVAIIDAADDLNVNAANAVLKTLEEPSGRGVLLLVSHAPGRLLPTIRSRCRRLPFSPWDDGEVARFVQERLGLGPEEAGRLATLAHGAPGRALSLAAAGALETDALAGQVMGALPEVDGSLLLSLADGLRGPAGAERFALTVSLMAERVHAGLRRSAVGAETDRWAAAWERLVNLPAEVEGLNLDRADAFWTVMDDLRRAARRAPLPC